MGEVLQEACPRCHSPAGKRCMRRGHKVRPCAIRQLLADRKRVKNPRSRLAQGIPNDELEALLIASSRNAPLHRLYRRLIETGL